MAAWIMLVDLLVRPASLVPSAFADVPLGLWTVLGGSVAVGGLSAARERLRKSQ